MKLVFYSVILNNHQANVADELWEQTGHSFRFVELANLAAEHRKGDATDYSTRPYLIRSWESSEAYAEAMQLASEAEACVFSGVMSLPFQKARLKRGLLSFDMSERWLKRGIANLFSPAIFKQWLAYKIGGWHRQPLYKLCCSGFAASDQRRINTFRDKCYKWGYFTKVDSTEPVASSAPHSEHIPIMWCSRYLILKHPEIPVLLAQQLKAKGYDFVVDMFGSGEYEEQTRRMVSHFGLDDVVKFRGTMPNAELLQEMHRHKIFLFTSDRNEGWGAVVNESMANGCVVVAADAIGSVPFLIKDGQTGMLFKSPKTTSSLTSPDAEALASLSAKVEFLLDNPDITDSIKLKALALMQNQWSPCQAATRLLTLISTLKRGDATPFEEGPCSKA